MRNKWLECLCRCPHYLSSSYSWTFDVRTVATVNARGLFTTTTDTGMTEVKARDLENPMNFGIAQVHPISIKAL